jgi:hypothetical protein
MSRFFKYRLTAVALVALSALAVIAVACGGEDSSTDLKPTGAVSESADGGYGATIGGGADAPGSRVSSGGGAPAATPAPSTAPRPSVFPTATPSASYGIPQSDTDSPSGPNAPLDDELAQFAQNRIIVRNVNMSIETRNIASIIEQIGTMTTQTGGWVVSTQHIKVHRGEISIRVPADRLDTTLRDLRALADNVLSEVSTSQDFTEEFTDTTARIQTLQDTVDALRALFTRADKIEDALTIQKEITRIQSDIEAMQARVNLLSQSAAFSLVRVTLSALPQEMSIDAGEDVLAAIGGPVRFRAEFTPPEGIENFEIVWDFGDGSGTYYVNTVAPVNTEGRVISAPITHAYYDETDSPYIVKVTVTGTGPAGAAKGEDVIVVTANRVPPIEVYAGDNQAVEAGEEVEFRGSFTRPDGVSNLSYTWDFGDGTAPVTVDADPGATLAEITHKFANSRPQSYNVILTVKGETSVGTTSGTGDLQVHVREPESLTAGGFEPGKSSKTAFRVLTAIGSGLGTLLIYLLVLSPIWLVIGAVIYFVYRRQTHNLKRRPGRTVEQLTDRQPES